MVAPPPLLQLARASSTSFQGEIEGTTEVHAVNGTGRRLATGTKESRAASVSDSGARSAVAPVAPNPTQLHHDAQRTAPVEQVDLSLAESSLGSVTDERPVGAADVYRASEQVWFDATGDQPKIDQREYVDFQPAALTAPAPASAARSPIPRNPRTRPHRPARNLGAWVVGGAFVVGILAGGGYLWITRKAEAAGADATAVAPAAGAAVAQIAAAVAPASVAAAVAPAGIPAAPAAAPVAPEVTPAVAPATARMVSVRFESQPGGATVTLVADGQPVVLGQTPLTAAIDPARRYDAMFALAEHETSIVPLDASGAAVAVVLHAAGVAAPPTLAVEPAAAAEPAVAAAVAITAPPVTEPAAHHRSHRSDRAARKSDKADTADKAEPAVASSGGSGTLMLGAKPPCEILVDGKSTGLTTPQRQLTLTAGKHSITLVNQEHAIKETFSVTVTAGQSTRSIKDFSEKL